MLEGAPALPVVLRHTYRTTGEVAPSAEPMGGPMAVRFQMVVDCTDPELLASFWAAALGYVLEPPPEGFATWDDWRRDIGLPDSELGIGADSIVDPRGEGPRIWFRVEPDAKVAKNRLHLDIHVSGGRSVTEGRSIPLATRTQRVDAEARRLADLGATITGALGDGSLDHYAVGMKDPEGNEFDIN
ncbi:MAG TPA: VOC family protein [Streptosporangiaceae bacterium]